MSLVNFSFLRGIKGIITAVIILGLAGGGWWYMRSRSNSAETFTLGKLERGSIRNTVNATGTLQAITTVLVGSQVSGTISKLMVDFNSVVKKGQIVAQLDPAIFQAQLASSKANLEAAKASLADAQSRVLTAEANVKSLQAGVSSTTANAQALKVQKDDANSFLQRQKELNKAGIVTQRDLESAQTAYEAAVARYNQALAQLDQAKVSEAQAASAGLAQARAQVKQSQAQVKQQEAAVQLAQVNLDHTTISSPIDGVVVDRSVDVGQTVAASLSAPTLFTIANDLTQMRVIANIDQADIGVINPNNRINFTVDAFPGQQFKGEIQQIRLNSLTVQNVVTYNVVILVSNPDLKLKPGMTTNLTITVAEKTDVLKIPNAALRFVPQGVTQDQIREMMRAGRPAQADAGGQASPGSSPRGEGQGENRRGKSGDQAGQGGSFGGGGKMDRAGKRPDRPGTPEMGPKMVTGAASSTPTQAEPRPRIVWVLGPDKKPVAKRIRIGITDGSSTEVVDGELKEGDQVITAQAVTSSQTQAGASQRAPGFGGGPGGPGGFGGGGGGGQRGR